MPDSQDDDLLAMKIEDYTVISDPKPVGSQFRLFERFRVVERMLLESSQCLSDTLFHGLIKRIDILNGSVGINKPVRHRPNTWV